MYNIYKTYLQSIILEAEDDDIDLNDLNDIEDSENNKPSENNDTDINKDETKKNPPKIEKPEEKKESDLTDYEMKFSIDLATEFSNTINEFTSVCSKIVEKRNIDKETSDKFYDLYSKIKNLADAASKTY